MAASPPLHSERGKTVSAIHQMQLGPLTPHGSATGCSHQSTGLRLTCKLYQGLGVVWTYYDLNLGCASLADNRSHWHFAVSPELAQCCRVRLRRLRSSLILLRRPSIEGAPRRLPSLQQRSMSASARCQVRAPGQLNPSAALADVVAVFRVQQ